MSFSPCQLPPLHKAARGGNLGEVKELVKKKADVNFRHAPLGVRISDNSSCNSRLVRLVNFSFSWV